MKRKPVYILCIFAAITVLIYMTGESYYSGITKKAGFEKKEEKVYQYQYDLIVDSPDSQFWQAVYASDGKLRHRTTSFWKSWDRIGEPPMTNWTT